MSRGNPKFQTKAERIRFAIRKKHLSEEDWSNQEIADELNVRPEMVSRYLNQTPQAEEVKKARDALEKEKWREMVTDINQRIDRLAELERQLWDVVEPAVTAYELVPAEAEISDYHLQQGGDNLKLDLAPGENDPGVPVDVEIPVPAQWKEIPAFSRLRQVWDERRRAEEQLSKILGLEADETLRLEGEMTERKVFAIENDEYPDAEPHQMGESPEPENSAQKDEKAETDEAQ